jgi:Rap1a immunity proteins
MKKLFLSLSLAISSFSASAEFIDGHKLQGWLRAEEDAGYAYVMGVSDTALGSSHCLPSNTSVKKVVALTLTAMDKAPSKLDLSGDLFVIAALTVAYPCKKTNSNTKNI